MTKAHASDLFVLGKPLTVTDERGRTVEFWLQKLNPHEHDKAVRKADAARARVLACVRDKEGDQYLALQSKVLKIEDRDILISFITAEEEARIVRRRDAELRAEDEWAKDGYLQGLYDAWHGTDGTDGLRGVYEQWIGFDDDEKAEADGDPEFVEARRVYAEMQRFVDQLNADVENELDALKDSYGDEERVSLATLQDKALERFVRLSGDNAWVDAMRNAEIYYGTRKHENHRQRYFTDPGQVDDLQEPMWLALREGFDLLIVDPTEGKDLPGSPGSSPSSETADEEETDVSSGLETSVP